MLLGSITTTTTPLSVDYKTLPLPLGVHFENVGN